MVQARAIPRRSPVGRLAGGAAAGAFVMLGLLHAAWGMGSNWPMSSREDLSDVVMGSPGLEENGATACYAVAGLLGTLGSLLIVRPNHLGRPRRLAITGVATVLASRGVLGLTGRTTLISPTSTGDRFRRLDRWLYSPLCLTLAALTIVAATDQTEETT